MLIVHHSDKRATIRAIMESIFTPDSNVFFFLFPAISPMVQNAKAVAHNPRDPNAAAQWRAANNQVRAKVMWQIWG